MHRQTDILIILSPNLETNDFHRHYFVYAHSDKGFQFIVNWTHEWKSTPSYSAMACLKDDCEDFIFKAIKLDMVIQLEKL